MADFGTELIRGFIVHRYKNFILDVKIADNRIVPVFCPDDDSGAGFYKEGTEVFVTRLKGRSKLHYELQLANPGGGVVMVNPRYNREMFEQAWEQGLLPEFSDYAELCPILHTEQLSHADYELTNAAGDKHFVYLTDVYNKRGAYAVFPAAVNFFELEMFEELRKLREKGYKTTVFMIVPRMDCIAVQFVWNIDPIAAAKIYEEAKNGLDFVSYSCNINQKSVSLANKLKIIY